LENVRFHREETKNDPSFSKSLADLADIFVLDAFGTAHRAHSSTVGVASYLPAYGGLLLYDEVKALTSMFSSPERPFLAIIGGSKVSSKLGVLKHLLDKVDTLAIVGAMAFTFLKSMGKEVGKSLVEDSYLDEAKQFLEKAKASRTKIVLPVDQVVVEKVDPLAESDVVEIDGFSPSMIGVDAGPATVAGLAEIIKASKMILWNGPLGIFEMDPFSVGTSEIARLLATVDAKTIVGGGDSVSALSKAGVKDKMTHISTGGGASLAFLEGVELPGLSILEDKDDA
ncbi:MAG: phosphoglycerate kinase, partial [Candidatus Marinamargulisbacteria bacterium]